MHRIGIRVRIPAIVGAVTLALIWSLASNHQVIAITGPQAPDRTLSVMTYNIHHGEGADGLLDLQRVADIIRGAGADVVALQEVDRHWSGRSACMDQAEWLAKELDMHYVYAANLDRDPSECSPSRSQYGTAILSRYPILESRNTLLPRPEGGEQRGLLEVLINVRGVHVRVYNTHLQHDSQVERTAQVEAIVEHMGDIDSPTILMGDLNASPDDPELTPLYAVLRDGWVESGDGPGYTYSSDDPYTRIDYIFISQDIQVRDINVIMNDQTAAASDHLPVLANLLLPGTAVGGGR